LQVAAAEVDNRQVAVVLVVFELAAQAVQAL
jgi:hypothetical protein